LRFCVAGYPPAVPADADPTPTRPVKDPRCRPCVLHDLRGAMNLLGYDDALKARIEARAVRWLDENFDKGGVPSRDITAVHRILKEESGDALPFRELRDGCNRVGRDVARRVAAEVAAAPPHERFRTLCLWAVAGNHLDFRTAGIGYGFGLDEVEGMLRGVVARGFDVDQTAEVERLARRAKRVLYVPDNVGEIAFDALLVREIRSYGAKVVVPYRGGPITSDATLADFQATGLDAAADEIFEAGPDTLGVSMEEASPRLRDEMARADLILTKGQANFYLAYGYREALAPAVACLLTTKCDVISSKFGTTRRLSLAVVVDRGGPLPQTR
jgi:uncharacterized protein with ATP-grasp and redox domains